MTLLSHCAIIRASIDPKQHLKTEEAVYMVPPTPFASYYYENTGVEMEQSQIRIQRGTIYSMRNVRALQAPNVYHRTIIVL